eukprot:evm.model.scf_223EXC.9 EVM.evm.TU.scf_223EXC.9   scf_223EXC:93481-93675(+)
MKHSVADQICRLRKGRITDLECDAEIALRELGRVHEKISAVREATEAAKVHHKQLECVDFAEGFE